MERCDTAILDRVRGPTFCTPDQQSGAGDAGPQITGFLRVEAKGLEDAHVVVELPTECTVLVLISTMHGQVPGLFLGQMRIFVLHAGKGVFQRGVAPGRAARYFAKFVGPIGQFFIDALARTFRLHQGRCSQAFDGDDAFHLFRIQACVLQADHAA